MNKLLDQLSARTLFLLDAIGALVTAFMLGVVWTHYAPHVGFSIEILYTLSTIALGFALYSSICYLRFPKLKWRIYMRGIAVANTLYCGLTIGLLIVQPTSTLLGWVYFLSEIGIIMGLVWIEWKKASKIEGS